MNLSSTRIYNKASLNGVTQEISIAWTEEVEKREEQHTPDLIREQKSKSLRDP